MFTKFLSIDEEKQQRIINAAIKEFTLNGYEKASTNTIVKEAGISKGLLFHYFTNKKQLLNFLYRYFLDQLVTEIYSSIDINEPDLFVRLRKTTQKKMNLIKQYPYSFKFVEKIYIENSPEIKDAILHINEEYKKNINLLFQDIDYSLFKDGLDIHKVINIILWTFDGFGNKLQDQARALNKDIDYDSAYKDFDQYVHILKTIFYK